MSKLPIALLHKAFVAVLTGALAVGVYNSRGATLYWDTDSSTAGDNSSSGAGLGGSGTWSGFNSNWWNTNANTIQAWTDGSDAIFEGMAGSVIASNVSVGSIFFKTNGHSIGSGMLTFTGTTANITVDSNVTATINSTIAGTNTLVKLGLGTLILANTNNLNTATNTAGGWRIEGGGTLRILADGSLGAALPDSARNTVTDIQLNQSTIQAGASFAVSINRRTKINTNASTNQGDAIIDTAGNAFTWYGSLQGGAGSLRVINSGPNPGILILGTDKLASINPFGSALPAGTINLTVQNGAIVQTSGTVTPTGGELGSETNTSGGLLAIKLDNGQIRSESGGYTFYRNLIIGPGGASLDTGAWIQTFFGGTITGSGGLTKEGTGTLVLDNPIASWTGGTTVHSGTLQLGQAGSNGLLPGTLANPYVTTLGAGTTLRFNRGSNKSFFDIIAGAGGVTVANTPTATVRLVSDNTYTGPTTISSGTLMIGQGHTGEPGSIVSSVVNNSGQLAFNRMENLTYAGSISGVGGVSTLALGTVTLTGTNSYTGATTVSAGTLVVNGVLGATAVNVVDGTLSGGGLIQGPVTISSGTFKPGSSLTTLTISNSLALSSPGVAIMNINAAANSSDLVRGLSSVSYGGLLILSNLSGTISASNSFKLFSANSYSGKFGSFNPTSPGANLAWNTNTLTIDGTLRVVSTTQPTLTAGRAGACCVNLSWPADHTGWRLQVQTNATGIGTNWTNVTNAVFTNQMTFPIDPSAGSIFYRLVYP